MYRDVADVRTILSLTWSMMILALLLVASASGKHLSVFAAARSDRSRRRNGARVVDK